MPDLFEVACYPQRTMKNGKRAVFGRRDEMDTIPTNCTNMAFLFRILLAAYHMVQCPHDSEHIWFVFSILHFRLL